METVKGRIHFSLFHPRSCSSCRNPQLMTIGTGRNVDQSGASASSSAPSSPQQTEASPQMSNRFTPRSLAPVFPLSQTGPQHTRHAQDLIAKGSVHTDRNLEDIDPSLNMSIKMFLYMTKAHSSPSLTPHRELSGKCQRVRTFSSNRRWKISFVPFKPVGRGDECVTNISK